LGVLPNISVAINPAQIEGTSRGKYQLVVGNPGLAPETVVLEGGSAGNQLGFRFEPPQLSLNPQSQAAATLTVWPAAAAKTPGQAATLAEQRTIDFWVTAKPASGKAKSGSARATFLHVVPEPTRQRPSWLIPVILGIVILISLCLIGFFIWYAVNGPTQQSLGSAGHPLNCEGHSILFSSFLARSVPDGSIRLYFG
jgi:hypothetical protein